MPFPDPISQIILGIPWSSIVIDHRISSTFKALRLNPKSIVFFIAFVPQFVDPGEPVLAQFAILEATFLVLAAVNVLIWALLVGEMRARFQRPALLRLVNRVGAGFLIGAGLITATARRFG